MNTRTPIDTSSGPIALSASFNAGNTRFSVGLDTGFCVLNTDPCEIKATREMNAGVGMAEMLGTSNYVALVGGGRQPKYAYNKVVIWDDGKQKAVITLEFRNAVLRVRLSRTRIVVALHNTVHIYKFSAQPEVIAAYETSDNPNGLCALTSKVIAFPGRTSGQVQLVEVETNNVSIIPAHTSALRGLCLSPDGQLLATASEAGTLLRVFSTINCSRLAELRRGVDYATIFDIAISPDNLMLAVTSDKLTLHIFDLPDTGRSSEDSRGARTGATSSMLLDEDASKHKWGIVGRLPFVPRVFSDEYSFASAPFETGGESISSPKIGDTAHRSIPGVPSGQPAKGIIGWVSDTGIVVVGAGRDARWERFEIMPGEDGKRYCVRRGWKRYLGPG